MANIKWVDYERTPAIDHILPMGEDGREKHERMPARMVFIGSNRERREVIPGGGEEEILMREVMKNNPEAHAEAKVAEGPKKIRVTKEYLALHPELIDQGVTAGKWIEAPQDSEDEENGPTNTNGVVRA